MTETSNKLSTATIILHRDLTASFLDWYQNHGKGIRPDYAYMMLKSWANVMRNFVATSSPVNPVDTELDIVTMDKLAAEISDTIIQFRAEKNKK